MRKYESGLAKRRDAFIVVGGLVLTAVFYINNGDIVKPLLFSVLVLTVSLFYSILFDRWIIRVPEKNELDLDVNERYAEVYSIASRIHKCLKTIKAESKEEPRFLIVYKFMKEIDEFESAIPKLVRSYKRGLLYFSGKNPLIHDEIREIERKIINSRGTARFNYKRTLSEKQTAVQEMENLRDSLNECESRLNYILGAVQKIEAIVEATNLSDGLSERDVVSLNNYMSTFSDNFKDIMKTMHI